MSDRNPIDGLADGSLESAIQQHAENQPENTFDEATMELMKLIKEKVPAECDAVIILKPHDSDAPIVFTQGHPYDTTALGAQFTRQMKNQLLPNLET